MLCHWRVEYVIKVVIESWDSGCFSSGTRLCIVGVGMIIRYVRCRLNNINIINATEESECLVNSNYTRLVDGLDLFAHLIDRIPER